MLKLPKIPLYLCLTCLALINQAVGAQTESSYQNSLKKIGSEISSLSRNLNANKSKLEVEQTQLLQAEQELHNINKRLNEARQGISAALEEIDKLEMTEKELLAEQNKSRDVLASLIESNYKNGVPSQLKMVLNQENPYAVGRLNNYQQYFSQAISQRFEVLQQQVLATKELKVKQREKAVELQNLEQEQEFLKKNQEEKRQKRQSAVSRLNAKVAATEEKLKKLEADRGRLNSLLKSLQKQKAELARIEREKAEADRIAAEKAKREGSKPPVERQPRKQKPRKVVKGGFKKQKGRLNCPVSVSAKTDFGQRIISSGMKSEGIFYDTKTSIDVRSVFRGQVLFADFLKGFGLLMIVDHGDDHISLYGHNRVLYKKVGDAVDTGEIISKTGTTGGLQSHGLYFEIRNNTMPVNPNSWCQ